MPAEIPCLYCDSDPARREKRDARLGPAGAHRIGVVRPGVPVQRNDRNRSLPLEPLKPLLRLPYEFHCLQQEVRESDRSVLMECRSLARYTEQLPDFAGKPRLRRRRWIW